jgi:diguanylate cyclase (GGDEF)-like protein/PAS domain S-box-containing protein
MSDRTGGGEQAADLARAWSDALGTDAPAELLHPLAAELMAAASAGTAEDARAAAARVGEALVAAGLTEPMVLDRTLVTVAARLPARPGTAGTVEAALAGVAAGYVAALRERTLAEQEVVREKAVAAQAGTEQRLRASEARLRSLFTDAAFGIALADLTARIIDANPAFCRMIGYSVGELTNRNAFDLVHPEDREAVEDLVYRRVAAGTGQVRVEKRLVCADGSARWVELAVSVVCDRQGRPSYLLAFGQDSTTRHELAERLRYRARRDGLTGLANRALFTDRLHQVFEGVGPDRRVGLCFLDLDGFKIINDSLGHHVGDELLQVVAGRLATAVGHHLVARLGGDEFVILVTDSAGEPQLIELAERVLGAVAEPVTVAGHQLTVTASIGIVERAAYGTEPAELMRAADITLYWAKAAGKSRLAIFDAARDARQAIRIQLAESMAGALAGAEFEMAYEPVVALADRQVLAVRACPRWRHPRWGLLDGAEFLGLAEEIGMRAQLGRWSLRAACATARGWLDRYGTAPRLSVGLSARQVCGGELADDVLGSLAEYQVPADLLQLELDEQALAGDQPLGTLRTLTEQGVHVVVDEFGTGYSNLTELRGAPVHGIRLAGSFTRSFDAPDGPDRADAAIGRAMVALAHTLSLTVTAAGVHTERQAARLQALGCEYGQGSLFGEPVPPEEIETLLTARALR